MYACMCVCMCVCIYVCVCMCVYVCVCMYVYVCMYVCMCVCMYVCMCVCNSCVPFLQLFATAILVSCVFAITDKRNVAPDKSIAPVLIGLVVFVIGATFGFNCGYAINPARDLGPRIFTAMAGWGQGVFTWVCYIQVTWTKLWGWRWGHGTRRDGVGQKYK